MSEPGIVALHGFTGGPRSFDRLKLPHMNAVYLAGHGTSPELDPADFEEEISRIATICEERSPAAPVHLLGYSMGARVALGLLLHRPDYFYGATLMSVNPGLESETARKARQAWELSWVEVLDEEGLDAFEKKWSSLPLFESQKSLATKEIKDLRKERLSQTSHGLAYAMRVLGLGAMPNYWPQLSSLTRPITLVVGEEDHKFCALAQLAAQRSSQINQEILPGVGHNPLIEAPREVRNIIQSDQARWLNK